MWQDIRSFLNWHADDWHHASVGQRYATLIGGAALLAICAGLCAL